MGQAIFGINHSRDFWKFCDCPRFTQAISKFSKMHSGNLSQIPPPPPAPRPKIKLNSEWLSKWITHTRAEGTTGAHLHYNSSKEISCAKTKFYQNPTTHSGIPKLREGLSVITQSLVNKRSNILISILISYFKNIKPKIMLFCWKYYNVLYYQRQKLCFLC